MEYRDFMSLVLDDAGNICLQILEIPGMLQIRALYYSNEKFRQQNVHMGSERAFHYAIFNIMADNMEFF